MAEGPEATRAKVQKRTVRMSKPPAYKPPVNDVKSNADRARSENYQNSKPYRRQVLATYKEQPTKQRSEIAHHATGPSLASVARYHNQALARNQELARSAAQKDTKGDHEYFRGRPQAKRDHEHEQLVQLARQILTMHKNNPEPGVQGDTKGALENATADAYKLLPQFQKDFSAAATAGALYDAEKKKAQEKGGGGVLGAATAYLAGKGPIAGAIQTAGSAIEKGIITASDKTPSWAQAINPAFVALKQGGHEVAAAGRELLDIPANVVPATYQTFEPLVGHGNLKETGNRLVKPYENLYHDPVGTFKKNPLSSTLMVVGGVRAADRAAGRAANVGVGHGPLGVPLPVVNNPARAKAFLPGTSIEQVRRAPKGILGQKMVPHMDLKNPHVTDAELRRQVAETFDHTQNVVRRQSEAAVAHHFDQIKAAGGKITRDVRNQTVELSKKAASIAREQAESETIDQFAVRAPKGKKLGTTGTHTITAGRHGIVAQFKSAQEAQDFIQRRDFGRNMMEFHDPTTNTWKVVPEAAALEMKRFGIGIKGGPVQTPAAKAAQAVVSSFRRAVLATPFTKWFTGNAAEAVVRSAINQVGPRSFITGVKAYNFAKHNWTEKEFEQFNNRVLGTGHYGMQLQYKMHTPPDEFIQSKLHPIAVGLDALKFGKLSPVRPLYATWQGWTHLVFPILNGKLESGFRLGMVGKALRDSPLMNDHVVKLHNDAIRQAMEGARNTPEMIQLGREVDRMFGKYGKFDPSTRKAIAHYTPFMAWYLNAASFVLSVLPRDHPVATALAASMSQQTEEWRKDHGLAMFMDKAVPPWLQGSVPVGGNKKVRASRYTPFGLWGDLPGSFASVMLPAVETSQNNLAGKDWKGDDLPANIKSNPYLLASVAAMNFMESTVPGTGILARMSGTQDKLFGSKASKQLSTSDRAKKEFNPFNPIAPAPPKKTKSKPKGLFPSSRSSQPSMFGGSSGSGPSMFGP